MKLIIDVPNEVLKSRHYCQYFGAWSTKLTETIENGIPYEERPQGDLISREALINVILNDRKLDGANANWEVNRILVHIDNAPTVEAFTEEYVSGAYNEGYACGSRENTRPQGECKNCKHFQESLCENSPNGWCLIRRATQEGDLETQVPKDYYCSWFEKGGAE